MQGKPNQFFLPFNGYKISDMDRPGAKGNLSNMKTHTFLNLSNDKTRLYAVKGRDENQEAKFHKNTVQNKLKKLIGSSKHQGDKLDSNASMNYKINDKLASPGNSRDKHLMKDKKNATKNQSTDSMSKLCVQVESYQQQRFPITAPHNKAGSNKQQFSAHNQPVKVDNCYSPKAIFKKNSEQIKHNKSTKQSAQTQGSKFSNIDRMNRTGTPISQGKAQNKSLQKVYDSKQKNSRNKSFRTDKVATKINNYMKNNFFLKSSYNNTQPGGFMHENSKLKGNTKPNIKNLTNIDIRQQQETIEKNLINSLNMEDKQVMIIDKLASGIKFNILLQIEDILNKIVHTTQKDFEIYDYIKEYVDIVQEENFEIYYEPIKSPRFQKAVKNGLIIERWAMFFIFYFYFNEKYFKENIKSIRKLVSLLHKNCVITLEFWSESLLLNPAYKAESQKLRTVLIKKQAKVSAADIDVNVINQNNNFIMSIFKASLQYLNPDIKNGILYLQQNMDKLSLKDGLDLCLDAFCQFLIEKGVVSVEYTQGENLQQQPQQQQQSNNIKQTTPKTQKNQVIHQNQQLVLSQNPNQKENAGVAKAQKNSNSNQNHEQQNSDKNNKENKQALVRPEPPFLPPCTKSQYTLVMDLDETLVHYEDNGVTGQFYLRPYAQEYLDEMGKYYEIVVFTAALQDYADWILNRLDTNNSVNYRLYRQHTYSQANYHIKDLSKLGRDLSKSIIVDNIPENFQLQPENGIYIKSWFKDPEDNALMELMPLLKEIVVKQVPDVRSALQKFRDKMIENIKKGCLQPHLNLTLD